MTKRSAAFAVLTAIALTAVVAVIIMSRYFSDVGTEAVGITGSGYTLGEYGGSLAIFRQGSTEPYKILETSVDELSDYDRELVINGITVSTEEELRALIEDYTS